jgi:hypothetical protein
MAKNVYNRAIAYFIKTDLEYGGENNLKQQWGVKFSTGSQDFLAPCRFLFCFSKARIR